MVDLKEMVAKFVNFVQNKEKMKIDVVLCFGEELNPKEKRIFRRNFDVSTIRFIAKEIFSNEVNLKKNLVSMRENFFSPIYRRKRENRIYPLLVDINSLSAGIVFNYFFTYILPQICSSNQEESLFSTNFRTEVIV